MRRISLALALVAAAGCGVGGNGLGSGGNKGVAEGFVRVVVKATEGGTVTSVPAGITCGDSGTACTFDFPLASPVTLSAAPTAVTSGAPNLFLGWAGDCSGEGACVLSGNADKYVLAQFGTTRTQHGNWATPSTHAQEWVKFVSGAAGAYVCTDCHGGTLQGRGIAPSCYACHSGFPQLPAEIVLPTLPPPAGGVTGVVYDRTGARVAGARVYAIPTGDLKQDSIYTPPEYDATAANAAGTLVEDAEGVFKALVSGPATAPTAFATTADWEFVAVVHTPHNFSARNSYRAGDLVIFANTAVGPGGEAIGTRLAVYEALISQRGSADTAGAGFWGTQGFPATANPPATASGDTAAWKYVGLADALEYWDNLAAFASTKAYGAGDLIRQGGKVYQAKAAFTSGASFSAGDWNLLGGLVDLAREADVDEPLEGTIRAHGYDATYFAMTDAQGVYTFTALPASFSGRYYLTVIPAGSDTLRLPGGDKARKPLVLATTQQNIELANVQSTGASYVGPSQCLNCHTNHNARTAHSLGLRKSFVSDSLRYTRPEPGALQDYSLFPGWLAAYDAIDANTKLCVTFGTSYKYVPRAASFDCSTLANAKFSIQFGSEVLPNGQKWWTATLVNIAGAGQWPGGTAPAGATAAPGKYYLELAYGGGIHKQRWLTKIGASRFTLPIQFNDEGSLDETLAGGRLRWQDYTNGDWYNTSTNAPVIIPGWRSFDNMCAGCHFTGYQLNVAANTATAVSDEQGDYDYDGDGDLDAMNVTCESCHGPGSEHVELARAGTPGGIVNPSKLTPERELAICSQCHTRFIGAGGLRSSGALKTEAPLKDVGGVAVMPRPGISRKEFLALHVSDIDDGVWDAKNGNGKYSVKHHQQASDYLTTTKYRNNGIPVGAYSVKAGFEGLGSCVSCHDLHGDTGLKRQLIRALDHNNGTSNGTSVTATLADGTTVTKTGSTGTVDGLCNGCHGKSLSGAISVTSTSGHNNRGSQTLHNAPNADFTCVSCHITKTAKSGSGAVTGQIRGETFYRGDISSHLFIGVPYGMAATPSRLSNDAKSTSTVSAANLMPMPWTGSDNVACLECHKADRTTAFKKSLF